MDKCTKEGKIEKILERVSDLELSRQRSDVLVETLISTTKDFSKTMKQVEKTMVSMNCSLAHNKEEISDLSTKFESLKKEVVEEKEKNKIDIRDVLKNHIAKIIMGGLGAYGTFELVTKVIEKQ